jgi:RNA polymerase sigma factor (sigma-70 family)
MKKHGSSAVIRGGRSSAGDAPSAEATDSELIRRIGDGDLGPLGILYDRYHADVRQFIAHATSGGGDTEDLTHDTFLTLSSIAARYDGRASARPFLIGIAAQLVRRRRRGVMRWARALASFAWSTGDDAAPLTPEISAAGNEEMRRFEDALARLSEDKRLVFLLVEREGLSGDEVASSLEIPVNTVWTRLHYARSELRRACSERASQARGAS